MSEVPYSTIISAQIRKMDELTAVIAVERTTPHASQFFINFRGALIISKNR